MKEKEISFKLPAAVYRNVLGISLLLGYDSLEDYLIELVEADVRMMLEDGGLDMQMESYYRKTHNQIPSSLSTIDR